MTAPMSDGRFEIPASTMGATSPAAPPKRPKLSVSQQQALGILYERAKPLMMSNRNGRYYIARNSAEKLEKLGYAEILLAETHRGYDTVRITAAGLEAHRALRAPQEGEQA